MKNSYERTLIEKRRLLVESFYGAFDKSRAVGWLDAYWKLSQEGRQLEGRIQEIGSGTFFTCLLEPASSSESQLRLVVKYTAPALLGGQTTPALPKSWLQAMLRLKKLVQLEQQTGQILHGISPFEVWQYEDRFVVTMPYADQKLTEKEWPDLPKLFDRTQAILKQEHLSVGQDFLQWRCWRGLPLLIDLSEVHFTNQ